MEAFEAMTLGFNLLLDWSVLLYLVLGVALGVLVGAIPGVSGMIAVSIMLIPSFYLTPVQAIVFLSSIYTGSIYGGGITAILLNIPGAPGAVATGFDGYELTRQGKHGEALGLGLMSSAFGSFAGYFIVLFLFIPIAGLVLMFGPPEMLMVVILALTLIGVARGGVIKTFVAGFFGLLIGTVGASPMGNMRGTFGISALYEGIPLVPAILGLLAVSELFNMVEAEYIVSTKAKEIKQDYKKIFYGMKSYFNYKLTAIRSAVVGVLIGIMPAAGTTVASMVSYGLAKRTSSRPDDFGKGTFEGVAAAETANNSSESGSMAVLMGFGIPGSGVAAVLMAGFMIHGMSPGPYLVRENLDFAYMLIIANLFTALFLFFIGLIYIRYFSSIVFVSTKILVPLIGIFAVLGALSERGLILDASILLIFGVIGYAVRKFEYPILALILGFMLGGMLEGEIIRTYLLFQGRFLEVFQRPIVSIFIVLIMLSLFYPYIARLFKKRKSNEVNTQ